MNAPAVRALPFALAFLLILPLPPAAEADVCLPEGLACTSVDCASTQARGTLQHVRADPSCADMALPVVPGMEESCHEEWRVAEPEDEPCCPDHDPCCPPPPHGWGTPPACCETPACCRADLACIVAWYVNTIRRRVSQEAAGHGFCIDVGQKDDGDPYADVDASGPCQHQSPPVEIRPPSPP